MTLSLDAERLHASPADLHLQRFIVAISSGAAPRRIRTTVSSSGAVTEQEGYDLADKEVFPEAYAVISRV